MRTPPYRIATDRLVVRCWIRATRRSSRRRRSSATFAAIRRRLVERPRQPRPQVLQARVVGGTGLHTRVGPDAFEIGYWIRTDAAGAGLATEASAALTRTALELCGAERVELRIDPRNEASLFAEDLPGSPAAAAAFAAHDAAGARVA